MSRHKKYFFSQRVIDHWNNLHDYVVNSFNDKLDTYWPNMSFKIALIA